MIDISESVARKTVTFDQPMTGADIIAAVRATAGDKFFEQKKYDDGMLHLVGQESSSAPHENLIVTPNKTDVYLSPDRTYDSAVVVRQTVQPGTRTTGRVSVDREINAVLEFSERFAEAARDVQRGSAERLRDPYAPAAGAVNRNPTRAAAERPIPPTPAPQAAVDRGW